MSTIIIVTEIIIILGILNLMKGRKLSAFFYAPPKKNKAFFFVICFIVFSFFFVFWLFCESVTKKPNQFDVCVCLLNIVTLKIQNVNTHNKTTHNNKAQYYEELICLSTHLCDTLEFAMFPRSWR